MSLASFPRPEVKYDVNTVCDPAKIALTFCGPEGAPLGHSIDSAVQPTKKKVNAPNPSQRVVSKKIDDEETVMKSEMLEKQNNMKKLKEEFLDKGILKALHGRIELRVQCACMSTDHLLLQRRTRLRELLLAEEVAYTTQYIAMCQQANASKEEELIRQASEMKANAERERKRFAEEKLLQQKILSCDAARPTLTQKQLKELKQDQLWQIKEKYALKEVQREEERMYHDLMMKNILAMKENEEENAKLSWKKQKEIKEAFLEQIKSKEKKKEETERQLKEFERMKIEEEIRLFKEAEIREKEKNIQHKEKMKAEFRELLEQEREKKERRKREEEEIERTFNELLKLQTEKEIEKETTTKNRLKKEMDAFLKKSKELKQKQEEEEKLFDQMLQELNEKKRKQKDAERKRLKEAREELFQNVLREREHQIKQKQELQRREAERERAEIELLTLQLEQQDKIREEYERTCAEQRREYQNSLLRQIEEVKEIKKKKKEEEEALLRQMKAKEEKEIEEIKVLLKTLPIFPQDHPMKTFIKENPPKYSCLHPYM